MAKSLDSLFSHVSRLFLSKGFPTGIIFSLVSLLVLHQGPEADPEGCSAMVAPPFGLGCIAPVQSG